MLTDKGRPAEGVILEAPFYNIVEEVELHPLTWVNTFNSLNKCHSFIPPIY
jgi:hypothetical protein